MTLRRIIICLQESRRVILYPEGGLEIEQHVAGIGWVIDTDGLDMEEAALASLLRAAGAVVENAAGHFQSA